MPELLTKVGVLLACFFDRYKNFKFINWYLDMTIEYKYNVQCFCLKRILQLSYRWAFLESTEISASEDLNALERPYLRL